MTQTLGCLIPHWPPGSTASTGEPAGDLKASFESTNVTNMALKVQNQQLSVNLIFQLVC